ncbi:phosphoribosylformimino-5-aminoimidazole carboxamide ribotide isomerase [Endozoicomonas montiporae]|uniref:Phosphoribosylformimino-5-aminoimidazole carboxamide ribotide isomerase n=2 Tax=Endozoicomonas montiporae TaxID=1027273 RepID=A0A081N8M5_9GAMM|nr:phosphoribosylformimino-5-aminoimidazole carboxamide ribotide isomerase [Endozoicomonas montiporae]AMO55297.1 phosphoribosylformimino-5-aminoimidazole carboxamide ribotide isomerase [Endozoicomonas montiporae CL-33]KEQ14798.1 phosphoribosylformimino-5-aminoimidazole carboxamide ribotide isomerase [Endozoicomonas montiporae]
MQFRPCIDLHNGKVKQIVGSSLTDSDNSASVNFESDQSPAEFAALYRRDSLLGGHVIKLGPGNESAAKEALAAWPGGLQIGGGITADNAADYLAMGASHVVVTSYVFRDGKVHHENLQKLVKAVGRERLVLDLSCKQKDGRYFIVTDRWQKFTETEVCPETLQQLAGSCDEILVHAASVEGMMAGPDLQLVALLAEHSPVPVTYAGGIASLDDLESIRKAGNNKVHITVGSALDIFGGTLEYRDVVEYCRL